MSGFFFSFLFALFNVRFYSIFTYAQLKYLDKDEFKDAPRLTKIRLDGNQLSVVIDHLFEAQKGLEYLGSNKKDENIERKRE